MLCIISRVNPKSSFRRFTFYRQNSLANNYIQTAQIQLNENIFGKYNFYNNRLLPSTMAFSSSSGLSSSSSLKKNYENRLANEKSPYLLQHAHNPVNWYPWGEEAIALAKKENKLIFLSIGYSTCHWCHVMEKESFEDEETAKIMNEKFINIKVDREERPEIDKIYMTFIVLINGSGGWPLSIFLTPDLAPVTGGTYFPPTDRWGMPGFKTILHKVALKWETSSDDLKETGLSVIEAIQKSASQRRVDGDTDDNPMTVEEKFRQAIKIYKRAYDPKWGGTNGAPKFPEISKLNFLFHAFVQTKDKEMLKLALITLDKIADGGIHDHVFGGFARYSVDKKWHIPHFEKMLYDQGQLMMSYSNAYKITRDTKYLEIADKIFKYVTKDLYHPAGGFYSGEDADSYPTAESKDKIEGAFYAWDYVEIEQLFKNNQNKFTVQNAFDIYCFHYDIKENGNVEASSDPHGHLLNKNIHFVKKSLAETAEMFGTNSESVASILKTGNEILHEVREKRPRPHLDNKIITGWNGLMLSGISKLACSGDAPNREEYLRVAKKQIEFLRENSFDVNERKLLRACYGEGENISRGSKPIYGFLDDYSFLIKGLIDYYVASLDMTMLYWAKELQELQDEYFWDSRNGGYFYSEASQSDVVVRMKEDHDGAEPAGNSAAAQNLILLGAYFEDQNFKSKAQSLTQFFSNVSPMGYVLPEMLSALTLDDAGLHMLVVVGPDDENTRSFIEIASDYYVPGLISILLIVDKPHEVTRQSVSQFKMVRNLPTAYCCHNKQCALPITDPKLLSEEFASKYLSSRI
ncbi:CLUMA_CG011311, isoform A [Clunio marinus]|uniref:CLUMA_CG011311, isoform A n=1 Tax=Clunio marinus TaxID=568069 RepID=A0A1J1IDU6_9DIPT|nr:CLUMA_CG011311, isoform A [Clunio marinus]